MSKDVTLDKPSPKHFGLTPLRAMAAAVGIYFAAQIVAFNIFGFYAAATGVDENQLESWIDGSVFVQFFLYLLIAVIGLLATGLIVKKLPGRWRAIGLVRPKPADALYAVAGYGYYLPLYILATVVFSQVIDFDQQQQLAFGDPAGDLELLVILVSLVVLPPIYEEILTRGLLFSGLRSRLKFLPAAIITSGLFAAAHLQFGGGAPLLWAAAVDTFILSMVLVTLREKTGSLWPAIGLHAIKNLVAFTLLFVLKVV